MTSALGDSYSEETLREQELRAAQIRKARERKEAQEARQQRREERVSALQKRLHSWKKKKKSPPPEPQDNVIQMPVSKLKPIRDTINTINEKAMNYADEMYAQADAGRWSWNRRARRLRRARWSRRPGSGRKSFAGSAGPGGSISLNRTSRPESWPSGTVRA